MKKGLSTLEISRQYGIHQETAWFFKRKVQAAMHNAKSASLSGLYNSTKPRSVALSLVLLEEIQEKRRSIQIETEVEPTDEDGTGSVKMKNGFAVVIKDYSSKELSNGNLEWLIEHYRR